MNLMPARKLSCVLWLIALLLSTLNLPAQAAEKALPDLVITDFWVEDDLVHYQIMNQGEAPTPATSHLTRLVVDGTLMYSDTISTVLAAGQRLERITHYPETCSGSEDVLVFEADATHLISESDEGNNSRQETWRCDSTTFVHCNWTCIHWAFLPSAYSKVTCWQRSTRSSATSKFLRARQRSPLRIHPQRS